MKVIQITDTHFKNEEGFFEAGESFCYWFINDVLRKQTEPFILLHSGDVYHRSVDYGKVNGLVARFFIAICQLPLCVKVIVVQGNHDIKKETGSALDFIDALDDKIKICYESELVKLDGDKYLYALPHFVPFSDISVSSYSDKEFHKLTAEPYLVSCHAGDETCGFFKKVDLSFLPGIKSHGDIHKRVSKNYLGASLVTRRDEKDRDCYYREFDLSTGKMDEKEIPLFLNYVEIPYGTNLKTFLAENPKKNPITTCIVDIVGSDSEDAVKMEYKEKYGNETFPKFYFDKVIREDRRGDVSEDLLSDDDLETDKVDIHEQFNIFCEEKKVSNKVAELVRSRL